jgi:hypothetical protein
MSRALLITALLLLVGAIAGFLFLRARASAAPEQPIPYSHQTHIQAGVQCLFCHSSALRSPVAGIPSVQKCMGCHNVIATDSPVIQEVTGYWERGEPIPWVRVNVQPDFVAFEHQPHLGAGVSCETCHGDIAQMDAARAVVRMDMGWCLSCHLEQPEEERTRLADCLTCHR